MAHSHAVQETKVKAVDSAFMLRVFYAFAILAVLSVAISLAGKWFGKSIAMAGHTDDASLHEIVIGNNVLSVPSNAIRFERDRKNSTSTRLDLYLHWPDMKGYSEATRHDFNNVGGAKKILFLTFEEKTMSRDMSGRFDPIYRSMIDQPGVSGPGGIVFYQFSKKSGYINEMLAVAERPGTTPFVARCLSGPSAGESLAPCERDIQVGENLSLTYRFPMELLSEWPNVDAAITIAAARSIQITH